LELAVAVFGAEFDLSILRVGAEAAYDGVGASAGLPGVPGQTYMNIVQDLIDGIGDCPYYADDENAAGYDNRGGWEYGCAVTSSDASWYDDNSPSPPIVDLESRFRRS
jgi:hypothetical protein